MSIGDKLLLGLDLGTSAIKGVLMTPAGEILAEEKATTEFLHPAPGMVEIAPEAHYRAVCRVIKALAERVPKGRAIAALSLAAASGNTLLLDKDMRPLTNIISWLDTRPVTSDLDAEAVRRVTGWPCLTIFPLAHLAWWQANEPERYRRAARVMMNNDYLHFRLTGKFALDHSTASTFELFDQVKRAWHRPYLAKYGLNEKQLSKPMPSGCKIGNLTPDAARDTGLSTACRLVSGCFDHPAAARACGVLNPGQLLLSCGTSWVGFYPVAERDQGLALKMLVDPFLAPDGPWGAMFSLAKIGDKVDSAVKGALGKLDFTEFNRLAALAPPGANGLDLNLFQDAVPAPRGKAEPELAAFCRALMEGVALAVRDKIANFAKAGLPTKRISMVGGPTNSPLWPQILADITGLSISIRNRQVAGAVGAAILAGIGAGIYTDESDALEKTKFATVQIIPKTC